MFSRCTEDGIAKQVDEYLKTTDCIQLYKTIFDGLQQNYERAETKGMIKQVSVSDEQKSSLHYLMLFFRFYSSSMPVEMVCAIMSFSTSFLISLGISGCPFSTL
jgi:hypothetical protein